MALKFEYENNKEEHISLEDFERDEKEAKKREQEDKRMRRHYKFSDKDQSTLGIASSLLALVSLGFIVWAIVLSTGAAGHGGTTVGILGAASFLCSLAGIVVGLLSFRETDVFYTFAWIGISCCGAIWLFVSTLIVLGI